MDQILHNFDPSPQVDKYGHFTYYLYPGLCQVTLRGLSTDPLPLLSPRSYGMAPMLAKRYFVAALMLVSACIDKSPGK